VPSMAKAGCKSIIAFIHVDTAYGKIRSSIIMLAIFGPDIENRSAAASDQ